MNECEKLVVAESKIFELEIQGSEQGPWGNQTKNSFSLIGLAEKGGQQIIMHVVSTPTNPGSAKLIGIAIGRASKLWTPVATIPHAPPR